MSKRKDVSTKPDSRDTDEQAADPRVQRARENVEKRLAELEARGPDDQPEASDRAERIAAAWRAKTGPKNEVSDAETIASWSYDDDFEDDEDGEEL